MTGKLDTYKLKFDKVFKLENDRVKAHEICTGMEVNRDFEIEIRGLMLVSTVEKEVAESLGFKIQVLNPDGSNADNGSTLANLKRAY